MGSMFEGMASTKRTSWDTEPTADWSTSTSHWKSCPMAYMHRNVPYADRLDLVRKMEDGGTIVLGSMPHEPSAETHVNPWTLYAPFSNVRQSVEGHTATCG